MNKVYKVMDKDKVVFYVKDVGKIGPMNPVYRIWKCENGEMVEGEYYYPHVCRKMSMNEGLCITKDKVLVPVRDSLNLDSDSLEFYLDAVGCSKGIKYTDLVEMNDEEIEEMSERCQDNYKDFKRIQELLEGE